MPGLPVFAGQDWETEDGDDVKIIEMTIDEVSNVREHLKGSGCKPGLHYSGIRGRIRHERAIAGAEVR